MCNHSRFCTYLWKELFTIKHLSQIEKLFCYYYHTLQNGKDAAIKSGFPTMRAEAKAAKLLLRADIQAQIAQFSSQKTDDKLLDCIVAGLNRLAFASSCDSLKFMLLDKESLLQQVDKLDLFHISEIKIPKEGALEIKFFDRFKAFDKLLEIARFQSNSDDATEFFAALEASAKSIDEVNADDEI